MRKLIILMFTLILFFPVSVLGKRPVEKVDIKLDVCGRIHKSVSCLNDTFSAGTVELVFKIIKKSECGMNAGGYIFIIEVKEEPGKIEMEPIYTGKTKEAVQRDTVLNYIRIGSVQLNNPGTTYQISIVRYKKDDFCLRKDPITIFSRAFKTRFRYYLGFHVAFLVPMGGINEYKLTYKKPEDEHLSIIETRNTSPYMLLYGAIYPWGFEPSLSPMKAFLKRLHIDIGFELTKNIFKTIYLGCGYNVVNYISLNVFLAYGKIDQLRDGFAVGPLTNENITEVPLDQKPELRMGIGFSMPIDFVASFFGRILNIE